MDKSILLDAVTDRLTEAFAELIHLKMRKELWGHAPDEDLSLDDLLKVTKDDGERQFQKAGNIPFQCVRPFRCQNSVQDMYSK